MSSVQNIYPIKTRYIAIEAHGKNMIYTQYRKNSVYQFQVIYMTHPTMKNIYDTYISGYQDCFIQISNQYNESYQRTFDKKLYQFYVR